MSVNRPERPLILIVDDNQVTLRLIEGTLSDSGYSVVTADSGENALLKVNEARPDLILLDVMMPEMSGYEVCSRLQENAETAYIPVIFFTALGDEQNRAKAFSVGGADYLVKPAKRDTLLKAVAKHLKTKSHWNKLKKERNLWDIAQPLNFTKFKTLPKQILCYKISKERTHIMSRKQRRFERRDLCGIQCRWFLGHQTLTNSSIPYI